MRSFERLIASGRVDRGRALLGRFLGIKPIMGMLPDGSVVPHSKAFGVKRARREMLRVLRDNVPPEARHVRFGVVHVGMPEIVDEIGAELREEYGRDVEVIGAPATPVISTHLGIGAWGLAWMVED